MQIKSDRIVFPDNTEQFTAGGGSGGGSTLESLGIPNHDQITVNATDRKVIIDGKENEGYLRLQNNVSTTSGGGLELKLTDLNGSLNNAKDGNLSFGTKNLERMRIGANNGGINLVSQNASNQGNLLRWEAGQLPGQSFGDLRFKRGGNNSALCNFELRVPTNWTTTQPITRLTIDQDGRMDVTGSLYVNGSAVGGASATFSKMAVYNHSTGSIKKQIGLSSISKSGSLILVFNFSGATANANYFVSAMHGRGTKTDDGNCAVGLAPNGSANLPSTTKCTVAYCEGGTASVLNSTHCMFGLAEF